VLLDYIIAPENIVTDLGVLPEFPIKDEIILKVFKSKNISLDINQFEVRKGSIKNDGNAIIDVREPDEKGKRKLYDLGPIKISYQLALDDSTVLNNLNLGEIYGDAREEGVVKIALGKKNPHLNTDHLDLKINRDGQATISPKKVDGKTFYVNHKDASDLNPIVITYKVNLEQAIKNSADLVLSRFYKASPTDFEKEFLNRVLDLNNKDGYTPNNSNLKFDYDENNGNVTLTADKDSEVYYNRAVITNYKINLTTALKDIKIDNLKTTDSKEIKDQIRSILEKNNPGFDARKVDLINIKDGHATLIPKADSRYITSQEVIINFAFDSESVKNDITDTPLHQQPKIDEGKELKEDLQNKNPGFYPKD
jgi:hypothetical protein